MVYREWYIITTGSVTVAASTMVATSIRVPDDNDWELAQILVANTTSVNFKYQIKKGKDDKYLSNKPILYIATNKIGSSTQEPYDIPPEGRVIFPSGTDIVVELTDTSASQNIIEFSMGGFKIKKQQ